MGIVTKRSPLAFHMSFWLFSSSKLVVTSLCILHIKETLWHKCLSVRKHLASQSSFVLHDHQQEYGDFAFLWRGADSSSNKQPEQASKWQSANEGESVFCRVHSQLLIRFWDFLHLRGNGRLILHQRLPCSVGGLRRSWPCRGFEATGRETLGQKL